MLAIYRRELQSYFFSPLGYVFMGSFLFVSGIFFAFGNIMSVSSSFGTMLSNVSFIFMLVVPILTMRLMSDERRHQDGPAFAHKPRLAVVHRGRQVLRRLHGVSPDLGAHGCLRHHPFRLWILSLAMCSSTTWAFS